MHDLNDSKSTETSYHSFMLRIWISEAGRDVAWRISIENPLTGEEHAFASLGELMSYLAELAVPFDKAKGPTE